MVNVKSNPLDFPNKLEKPKKQDKKNDIFEIFQKVDINILLLDAIKQVPKFTKFLKKFCVNKKKLRGDEQIVVGETISAILQRKLPPKCGDPGMFTIPYKLGHSRISSDMLDLVTSINVMPKYIYDSLNLKPLKEIGIIIQLTEHLNVCPDEVIENA